MGADPKEIIFTSGATESNNLAIKGVAGFYRDKKKHLITTQTERARPSAAVCPWWKSSLSRHPAQCAPLSAPSLNGRAGVEGGIL